jgi:ABC-2 type transport system ATP-binding protein
MAPTVAVDGYSHRFGRHLAVDVPRLVIPPGTTALLGPNGSGKSTLLRAIASVTPAQDGRITVNGANLAVASERLAVRRRLGYVAQRDVLPKRMRVGEFCDYVGALKEIGPARIRRRWTNHALASVGLADHAGARIGSLSGGMARRLSLAQAYLGNPSLVVLDEPLSSLDPAHRSATVARIASHHIGAAPQPDSPPERSTIAATHHIDELASVCAHLVVLAQGRLAFTGTPAELAAHAAGNVWETEHPVHHPTVRAVGASLFRLVGPPPPGARPATPTPHDGYLALLAGLTPQDGLSPGAGGTD